MLNPLPLSLGKQSKDKVKLYKLLPIPPEEGAKPDPSAVVKKDWVEQGHGVIKILEKIQPGRPVFCLVSTGR